MDPSLPQPCLGRAGDGVEGSKWPQENCFIKFSLYQHEQNTHMKNVHASGWSLCMCGMYNLSNEALLIYTRDKYIEYLYIRARSY